MELSESTASLMILLILALATMLDGLRIGWQFSLLGFYLAACALMVVYIDSFEWGCAGLAVLVVAGSLLWAIRLSKQSEIDEG